MTLGEFFTLCGQNPSILLGFFILIPAVAALLLIISKGQGVAWKPVYTILIYLVALPGIFAITLSVYLFLFERRSIMDTNIYTQVLPIVSMMATFILIRKQVNLDEVPGFDKLSGLVTIIFVMISLMWFIDKTHIYAITFMPFYVVILILLAGYFLVRAGLKQLAR